MRILIVEDDAELSAAMSDYLALQGAECDFAYHGASGLTLAREHRFDVIILDLMLPRIDGVEVCEQLRCQGVFTPVLMLTACDTHTEQLRGFQAGIDDYVVKPSTMPLIWARVQALYRRSQPSVDKLSVDTLTCYFKEQRVVREGREIKLTPTGWKILSLLIRRSPEVVSRSEIEDYVWPDEDVESGNFNVQLHQLRKALDKPFAYPLIHTLVGRGLSLRKKADDRGDGTTLAG
jgi:DNA-binding response OmpR family regulator